MATTTNYSWTTPDDTALVKDGAAAIRSLGTAIDSTVFTNAGAAINKSLVDAAGDLIYGTADNTVARLAIGTATQILAVNSGATAPEWVTPAGGGANWSLLNAGGTNLTGATTVTVSGISGKDKLMIVVDGASAGSSSVISVRFNGDTGNNYTFGDGPGFGITPPSSGSLIAGYDRIVLGDLANNAASVLRGWFQISGCNAAGVKVGNFSASGNDPGTGQTGSSSFALYSGTSVISSVSIVSSSGNLDAGKVYIYQSA
jgi:hypothetical protein